MLLDADQIVPRIWQGGLPQVEKPSLYKDFDVLVLCAVEHQLAAHHFPGIKVIHAPNRDDFSERAPLLTLEELHIANKTAQVAVEEYRKGRSILVTCFAGINRSGLVTALMLHHIFGYSGDACIKLIRERRKSCLYSNLPLSNPGFVKALKKLRKKPHGV